MTRVSTRREWFKSAGWTYAAVLLGCSGGQQTGWGGGATEGGRKEPGMKLSLSARVAESFHDKEKTSMTIDELIDLARANGFSALCMRASQAGVHTPPERVQAMSEKIRRSGLVVSMVTGDFAVPRNDEHGPGGLRKITPYLDLADTFGASLIRVCMKTEADISWAQRASDEAEERGIRLAHQSHLNSLFETVAGSLDVLQAVGRSNFGIIYEPANWMIAGEDYARNAIERLREHIFNVYVQNHRIDPEGEAVLKTLKGTVRVDHIGLWESGGVDFETVFAALHGIDYRGYVTVHQAFEGVMSVEEAVRKSSRYLEQLIA